MIFKNILKIQTLDILPTLGHSPIAERQIRTIKDTIHKRMKNSDTDQWTDHI